MKKLKFLIALVFLTFINAKGQTNSIVFTYDIGGNMIQRQLQVIPPLPPGGNRLSIPKDSTEILPALNFKIFPNPTNQYINIEGELPKEFEEAKITLLNSEGKILKTETYNGQTKTMDVSDLKNGLYMLEVNYSKNKRSTYKIIVSK